MPPNFLTSSLLRVTGLLYTSSLVSLYPLRYPGGPLVVGSPHYTSTPTTLLSLNLSYRVSSTSVFFLTQDARALWGSSVDHVEFFGLDFSNFPFPFPMYFVLCSGRFLDRFPSLSILLSFFFPCLLGLTYVFFQGA